MSGPPAPIDIEPTERDLLNPIDRTALYEAVGLLENSNIAIRLADFAGKPLNRMMRFIPGSGGVLRGVVHSAIMRCLEVAIDSLDEKKFEPSTWLPKAMTGVTGGLGGLFGAVALPVELPVTTALMLRSIADIARHHGEDLAEIEARLACLEVFALGGGRTNADVDIGYYATRAVFVKLSGDVVAYIVERGVVDATAPVIARMVSEVVSRFGLVLSEKMAAGAVPLLGAVSGATVNVIFMDHFERVANGHFALRRLERRYGRDVIGRLYAEEAERRYAARRKLPVVATRRRAFSAPR
jgi:CheY-like chemotaxis protein